MLLNYKPMRKKNIFKETLLVSQEDMALLLHVNKSQWAMYEIGERDLPNDAKLKLAKLIELTTALQKEQQKTDQEILQEGKRNELLNKYINDNYIKQLSTLRKLETIQRKYHEALRTHHFICLLQNDNEISTKHQTLLQDMSNKAKNTMERHGLHVQLDYEVKLKTLQYEEKILKKRLTKSDSA